MPRLHHLVSDESLRKGVVYRADEKCKRQDAVGDGRNDTRKKGQTAAAASPR